MWIVVLVLLLLGAQLNLTALVPLASGEAPPPWWVGGMVLWPFAEDTRPLVPIGAELAGLTPLVGLVAAAFFAMAAFALLGWWVPAGWFAWLIVAGAVVSIVLHFVWLSPWAVLPLLVNGVLLWLVFSGNADVGTLRG